MFGWLSKKQEPQLFPDNTAAFEFACRNLDNRILLEAVVTALVDEVGRPGEEGERWFRLRLADPTGGRELWACTLKEALDFPELGDLVGFKVVKIASDLPEGMNIIGFIAYKLEPVFMGKKGWKIEKSYIPKNIRQTVRF